MGTIKGVWGDLTFSESILSPIPRFLQWSPTITVGKQVRRKTEVKHAPPCRLDEWLQFDLKPLDAFVFV